MKALGAVLLLSFSLPSAALAADPAPARCRIVIPADPTREPNKYQKKIADLEIPPDGTTHYLLLNEDRTSSEEISKDAYFAFKADGFRAIAGRYVVLMLKTSDGLTMIYYGTADAKAVALNGGATVYGVDGQRTIVVPDGAKFGVECAQETK